MTTPSALWALSGGAHRLPTAVLSPSKWAAGFQGRRRGPAPILERDTAIFIIRKTRACDWSEENRLAQVWEVQLRENDKNEIAAALKAAR